MLRRVQQLLQTQLFRHSGTQPAQAQIHDCEQESGQHRPSLQLPASLATKEPDKKVSLPPLPRPMGPLLSQSYERIAPIQTLTLTTPLPVRKESEAPSLAEICAEQAPTALIKTLHEQARWFYEYRPTRPQLISGMSTSKITCRPLPTLLDYQRLQLKVEQPESEYISLNLEVESQPEAVILIGDVQPGQFSGSHLRIPTNREIEVCFRIFTSRETRCAIKLSPTDPDPVLSPIISDCCFSAETQH